MDINSDCFGFNVKGNKKQKKIKIEKNQMVEKEGGWLFFKCGRTKLRNFDFFFHAFLMR